MYLIFVIYVYQDIVNFIVNPIKHGVRQVAISWGGVQSARSLIGLSRDLIGHFLGHHTPLYSVGVYYGASRKKYSKNLEKRSSFHKFCPIIQFSEKNEKFEFSNLKLS